MALLLGLSLLCTRPTRSDRKAAIRANLAAFRAGVRAVYVRVREAQLPRLEIVIKERRIVFVVAPTALALEVAGPAEVFAMANRHLEDTRRKGAPRYSLEFYSADATPKITTPSGITMQTSGSFQKIHGEVDTILLVDGMRPWKGSSSSGLSKWIREYVPRARRVASVCTGVFLLAEAGVLDGKRVTTHWAYTEELHRRYPKLRLDANAIYVRDGKISTSAGVTAGLDLTLAFVEEDLGTEVALYVARGLVLFLRRYQGQHQYSTSLAFQGKVRLPLREMPIFILENLQRDLSVKSLAARVGMSPRNFSRIFREEVGEPPATFVQRLRLETAKRLLEESDRNIDDIARICGWVNRTNLSRAFKRTYAQTPSEARKVKLEIKGSGRNKHTQ